MCGWRVTIRKTAVFLGSIRKTQNPVFQIVHDESVKSVNTLNKNTHSMYGGDCDAAIAKAAAAVTHVQSQSQEVGSGDGRAGLVVF